MTMVIEREVAEAIPNQNNGIVKKAAFTTTQERIKRAIGGIKTNLDVRLNLAEARALYGPGITYSGTDGPIRPEVIAKVRDLQEKVSQNWKISDKEYRKRREIVHQSI